MLLCIFSSGGGPTSFRTLMKIVGLLSGGKDSCFNLCHCVLHGHEVVALATLAPPYGKDEIDSYMYQTVGHDAVHAIAEALDVPLYRAEIHGLALNQGAVYGERDPTKKCSGSLDDETEDLYRLLLHVKEKHPDIEGVSVGAILSNYQRVRVEHVCSRPDLGLTSLAYLWKRDQNELLHEMNQAGMEVLMIKAAGIGLSERDLGRQLSVLTPKLEELYRLYGAHVCGEGGEYESLCVDSPLFKRKISVDEKETVIHSDAAFATVSYLRILRTSFVDKEEYGPAVVAERLEAPPLLDDAGEMFLRTLRAHPYQWKQDSQLSTYKPWKLTMSVSQQGPWITMTEISADGMNHPNFEDEALCAFQQLHTVLQKYGMDRTNITHVNVYLASQAYFAPLNQVYQREFGAAPPSRACVALPNASSSIRIKLDVVACRSSSTHERRSMHVQSCSYWAPACIGPYSQAICDHGRMYMAGQIGMVPSTLDVPQDIPTQLALCLQNQQRVSAIRAEWSRYGWSEGGLCWLSPSNDMDLTSCMDALWQYASPMLFVHLPPESLPKKALCEWQLTERTCDDKVEPGTKTASFVAHGVSCTFRVCAFDSLSSGTAILSSTQRNHENSELRSDLDHVLHGAVHLKLIYDAQNGPDVALTLLQKVTNQTLPAITLIPALHWHMPGIQCSHEPPSSCALVWL